MLNTYINRTNRLLTYPNPTPTALYSTADITDWVNQARGQVAGEGQCILALGTLTTIIGQRNYNFSSINFGTPSSTGIQGALNVMRLTYNVASGQKWIDPRQWPWFDYYHLNNPVPVNGPPAVWSQLGQGSAGIGTITGIGAGSMASGSFYLDPPPNGIYTLNCLSVCYPQALAADSDFEVLPYLWTDSVPYYAAYLALLSAQSGQREGEAARMFERYQSFIERARKAANPDWLKHIYFGSPDPSQLAKLQIGGKGAA